MKIFLKNNQKQYITYILYWEIGITKKRYVKSSEISVPSHEASLILSSYLFNTNIVNIWQQRVLENRYEMKLQQFALIYICKSIS